jgi:hypothetical protein
MPSMKNPVILPEEPPDRFPIYHKPGSYFNTKYGRRKSLGDARKAGVNRREISEMIMEKKLNRRGRRARRD